MAEHRRLYQRALYYDIAGDFTDEVEFLLAVCQRHGGRAPRSALELACGPGYHARELARRGIRSIGLDLSPDMIRLARQRSQQDSVAVEWLVGDMRRFTLRDPVDPTFCTLDGIDCLLTEAEVIEHLGVVGPNLTPRGLYVIERSHPRDCSADHYADSRYAGTRGGYSVVIDWGTNRPIKADHDMVKVVNVEVTMRVRRNGQEQVFVDQARERLLTLDDITDLVCWSSTLELCALYGDFLMGQPYDEGPSSRRLIVVLRKPG